MDEKEVIPALSRVLKSIVQEAMFISKRKLNNTKCIVLIKREISLLKVCLTCNITLHLTRTINSSFA